MEATSGQRKSTALWRSAFSPSAGKGRRFPSAAGTMQRALILQRCIRTERLPLSHSLAHNAKHAGRGGECTLPQVGLFQLRPIALGSELIYFVSRELQVSSPSGVSPHRCWKLFTAFSVMRPNLPSGFSRPLRAAPEYDRMTSRHLAIYGGDVQ